MELPEGYGICKATFYEIGRPAPDQDAIELFRVKIIHNIKNDESYSAIIEKTGVGKIIQAKNDYVGKGSTELEALNDCVRKIENASRDEIFPEQNFQVNES